MGLGDWIQARMSPDESMERERYAETNSLGNCQKCGTRLADHKFIGRFCPVCTYFSIEKSFALAAPQLEAGLDGGTET